ncbi:hypothetical protein [Serinicoccus sp. LYQ131]|uniref:hypothetical protein n=1 Tax=Serinicoccus sp. LYQ131 TaxID=3378797 RepID=UPI003854B73B
MGQPDESVAVFEAEDGILVFGSESALSLLDADISVPFRPISGKQLARVTGHVGTAAGTISAESGRWLKLTRESAGHLDTFKATSIGKDGLLAGTLRTNSGQITKHLKFENISKGALLTPAAPMLLGSMATQYALESALDDITTYLETIDRKLDQLLKQRKTETLGQIGGVTLAIDEAYALLASTGTVSATTWSKVQATSLSLQTMQSEAIAQLSDVAESIETVRGHADKTAKALERAAEDTQFWLGVLARTIALQDRQYVLELARVAEESPLQLDDHRRGITDARRNRVQRIVAGLEAVNAAVTATSTLSNRAKVANPINAPKIARRSHAITSDIATFAVHTELDFLEPGDVSATPWSQAALGLIGEATSAVGAVGAVGSGAVHQAQALGHAVEERRDQAVLRKAEKIEEKRRARE